MLHRYQSWSVHPAYVVLTGFFKEIKSTTARVAAQQARSISPLTFPCRFISRALFHSRQSDVSNNAAGFLADFCTKELTSTGTTFSSPPADTRSDRPKDILAKDLARGALYLWLWLDRGCAALGAKVCCITCGSGLQLLPEL